MDGDELDNSFSGTWGSKLERNLKIYGAANNAPNAPFITIETHEGVVTPVAAFSANVTSGLNPLTVQFTDASTNTPTSWNWTFGDGSTNQTTHFNPRTTTTQPMEPILSI